MGQVVELLPHHNVTSLKVVAFWVVLGDLDKPSKPSVFAVSAGGFFLLRSQAPEELERETAKQSCKSYTLAFSYKSKQKGVRTGKAISRGKKLREELENFM